MLLESICNLTWPLAQAAADRTWLDALLEIRTEKLVIILIFGTGLISAAGYAVSQVLRAANGSPDEGDDLLAQITELEQRVRKLELAATRVNAPEEVLN